MSNDAHKIGGGTGIHGGEEGRRGRGRTDKKAKITPGKKRRKQRENKRREKRERKRKRRINGFLLTGDAENVFFCFTANLPGR